MALSAAQHASKSRILTQPEPAKMPSTVDAVVLKHGRVFRLHRRRSHNGSTSCGRGCPRGAIGWRSTICASAPPARTCASSAAPTVTWRSPPTCAAA